MTENNASCIEFINRLSTVDIVLTYFGSSLSIFGSILIFLVHYLRWMTGKGIDNVRKYLLCLTLADLGNAVGYFWGVSRFVTSSDLKETNISACPIKQEPGCIGQSFMTTSFTLSSFFWTALIAFHLYSKYGVNPEQRTTRRRWIAYSAIGWGIPLIITIVAVSLNKLGSDLSVGSGAWCWISACLSPDERTLWMTISGRGWEILMYCFCFACYILIKWEKIKSRRHIIKTNGNNLTSRYGSVQRTLATQQEEDLRFLLLWMVEVGLRIFGTVRYIVAAVRRHTCEELPNYDAVDKWFLHFQSFGDSAQAFVSCVLFCFEKDALTLLKDVITRKTMESVERQSLRQENKSAECQSLRQENKSAECQSLRQGNTSVELVTIVS